MTSENDRLNLAFLEREENDLKNKSFSDKRGVIYPISNEIK